LIKLETVGATSWYFLYLSGLTQTDNTRGYLAPSDFLDLQLDDKGCLRVSRHAKSIGLGKEDRIPLSAASAQFSAIYNLACSLLRAQPRPIRY